MSDYEVLKECKQAYETLNDLLDNCELFYGSGEVERTDLQNASFVLGDIYERAYEKMKKTDEDGLRTGVHCPRCNKDLMISDIIGYAYLCNECDENMYLCEGDVNFVWWNL